MRTAFVRELRQLMKEHKDVVTLTADMGFSVFEDLQKEFPKRFLNTGVTEQSTVGVATGFALSGYKVFVYAQAAFITMRCFEQVRLDVCYNNLNVKLIGTAAGFSLPQLGVSHFSLEDVALMRTLPNITVFTPGDPPEARWATEKAYTIDGPAYIRLTKAGCPVIHASVPTIRVGESIVVREGDDAALLVSGGMLPIAVDVAEQLKRKKIHISIHSFPTVKPIDKKIILNLAKKGKHIFTLEDHSVIGGLGTAVAEILAESGNSVPFKRLGAPDSFTGITGSIEYLQKVNGLSVSNITGTIMHSLQ
jgi:transketolase